MRGIGRGATDADRRGVSSRSYLMIGMTLASVAVGGWKSLIPGLDFAQASSSGQSPIAELSGLTQAASALAAYHGIAGTYSGAELGTTRTVRIAWASDTAYCLEGGSLHLVGPVGVPLPGPCLAG
jgi:hypothetical protein